MTDAIKLFRERRERRLAKRGLYHADAPDDEQQSNNNQKDIGGHGNTRLPYGLCQRYGIEIQPGWTPRDAWDALAGKGITPDGAYSRLKKGEDPGTPDTPPEPEKKKEPQKDVVDRDGRTYKDIKLIHASWSTYPFRIKGMADDGTKLFETFDTKNDMFWYLKDRGVEEVTDPVTGEIVNPQEMELPKRLFEKPFSEGSWYSAVTIGYRGGVFTVHGTGLDGKKEKIAEKPSYKEAVDQLKRYGVSEEDIKTSPAAKKREKERKAWLTSDKKEYIEKDGVKYGDLRTDYSGYGGYTLMASDESGKEINEHFRTKTELISFLKNQDVEKIKIGDEEINPKEYKIPDTVAKYAGVSYQKIYYEKGGVFGDELRVSGIDLDGRKKHLFAKSENETFDQFRDRLMMAFSMSPEKIEASDDVKKMIEDIKQKDGERRKRKAEFEAKAVSFSGYKYADIHVEETGHGTFRLVGYNENGIEKRLSYSSDMYEICEMLKKNNIEPETVMKSDSVREKYEEYKKFKDEFDARSVEIGHTRYVDVHLELDAYGSGFALLGNDITGSERVIELGTYDDIDNMLKKETGKSVQDYPMEDDARKYAEFIKKEKDGLASGEYSDINGHAYKDIFVKKLDESYTGLKFNIYGRDVNGEEKFIKTIVDRDDAIDFLESKGITDYKFMMDDGTEISRPLDGMRHPRIRVAPDGSYRILAKTGKNTWGEVRSLSTAEEARKFLRENGFDTSKIKIKTMNPNDDVSRTHDMLSLSAFDEHRAMQEDEESILRGMTDEQKQKVVEMLTDVFNQSSYRIRMRGHFEDVFDEHFKNLLETGTSGGSTCKDGRRTTGERCFGHDYDIDPVEAEKYGYLGVDDDMTEFENHIATWYGGIVYKIKKEAVDNRVTYTFGDTLDAGRPLAGYAGTKPTYEGVCGLRRKSTLESILEKYEKYKKGELSFNQFHAYLSEKCTNGYVECQYHGLLTIDDVDTITFPRSTFIETFNRMRPEKRQIVVTKLKERGIIMKYKDNVTDELKDCYEYLKDKYGVT